MQDWHWNERRRRWEPATKWDRVHGWVDEYGARIVLGGVIVLLAIALPLWLSRSGL